MRESNSVSAAWGGGAKKRETNQPAMVDKLAGGSGRKMTVMAQRLQTTIEAPKAQRRIHRERAPAEDERTRLQVLIAELLSENQKLRFKVAQLEQQAQRAERRLAEAKE
jgi:hypothetical protein